MSNTPQYVLGVEIGGSKLQVGLGGLCTEDIDELWRADIDASQGAGPIRAQIVQGVDELLRMRSLSKEDIVGIGIGFGGPIDSAHGRIMTSHQVGGWDDFPLGDWVRKELGLLAIVHNDADTAALAEAHYGAGRGYDPVLYLTVGSGIGGGLVVRERIFRGSGRGAAEIGHLRPGNLPKGFSCQGTTVEQIASGFGITQRAKHANSELQASQLLQLVGGDPEGINTKLIAQAADNGDQFCRGLLNDAAEALGWAIAQAITLVNPSRVVIGGGVSMIGEELLFEPVRAACRKHVFAPFAEVAEIVPAALGEEVVIHGALALARDAFAED